MLISDRSAGGSPPGPAPAQAGSNRIGIFLQAGHDFIYFSTLITAAEPEPCPPDLGQALAKLGTKRKETA